MSSITSFIAIASSLIGGAIAIHTQSSTPAIEIAAKTLKEAGNSPKEEPSLKLSEKGFMKECSSKEELIFMLKKVGVVEDNENIVYLEDQDFQRGGAECYFSPFKIEVKDENESHKVKYGVIKSWLGFRKGSMMEKRREHLTRCGMKVIPQFGTLPSEKDVHEIQVTFQHHANPSFYESNERVLEAIDVADELTPEQGSEAGKMAAILDANRYSPTRVLADVLMTENGLAFNDFGYDLGDPGPETQKYYGCEVPIDYFNGIRALKQELRKNPNALDAAIKAYTVYREISVKDVETALR